jgi:hypothetical protein
MTFLEQYKVCSWQLRLGTRELQGHMGCIVIVGWFILLHCNVAYVVSQLVLLHDQNIYSVKYKLSAMDVLGLVSMKDAANCDKQYDLQISENHQLFERERYPWALL